MRTKIVVSLLLALGAAPALAQKLPPLPGDSQFHPPLFGPLPAFDCGSLEPQPIGDGMTMQAVRTPFMHETSVLPNQGKTDLCPKVFSTETWPACMMITLPDKQQFLVKVTNDLLDLDGASLKGMSMDQKQRIQGIGYRTIQRCKESAELIDSKTKRVTCTSVMPKNTYDDIDVPPGGACILTDGTVVKGKLMVGKGAKLYITKANVAGLEVNQPAEIRLGQAIITGDLQITGSGTSAMITISECDISGKLVITNLEHAFFVQITRNKIGGDLVFSKNLVASTQVTLTDNSIRGNLSCDGNVPRIQTPLGNKNTVGGQKLGQCSHL